MQFTRTVDNFDIFDSKSEFRHHVASLLVFVKELKAILYKRTYDILKTNTVPLQTPDENKSALYIYVDL